MLNQLCCYKKPCKILPCNRANKSRYFGATKKPAKYYPIVWQKNPDFQANLIAITCCNQLWCYKKTCKHKIFVMAVYMIFKYSKRFHFAPSFDNENCIYGDMPAFGQSRCLYILSKDFHKITANCISWIHYFFQF